MHDQEDQQTEERTLSYSGQESGVPVPPGIPHRRDASDLYHSSVYTVSEAVSLFYKDPSLFMALQLTSDTLLQRDQV